MAPGNRSKGRAEPRRRSQVQGRRSKVPGGPTPRLVQVHNGHPRLVPDRRAVAAVIHLLDAHAAEIVGLPTSALRPLNSGPRPGTFDLRPATSSGPPPGELSIAFLTDAALAGLHGRFLHDPSATDVITFAGDPAPGPAGEICLSVDAARAFARKHRRDFSAELTLYLVHGWLHLAGHDDLEPAKKRRMRAAEARAMALLRRAGAMPDFRMK